MSNHPTTPFWTQRDDDQSPIVTTAIHDGHLLRPAIAAVMLLDDAGRLREEDPHTGEWTGITSAQVIGRYSRFEADLNRPREKAIYRVPEDAWGLEVYAEDLPEALVAESLARYDAFYRAMEGLFWKKILQFGHCVVLDLHTYNHRREGTAGPAADPAANPEVNLGTATLPEAAKWRPLIDRLTADLHGYDYDGRQLDVRENVKFKGGNFAAWLHRRFPGSICVISIEFKKFFMDEWTGEPDQRQVRQIKQTLAGTLPGIEKSLETIA